MALTRAKHGMIIVGNERTLMHDKKWKTLLNFLKQDGQYFNNYEEAYSFIYENDQPDVREAMSLKIPKEVNIPLPKQKPEPKPKPLVNPKPKHNKYAQKLMKEIEK